MNPLDFVKTYSIPHDVVARYKDYTSKLSESDWEPHCWYCAKTDEISTRPENEPLVTEVLDNELSRDLTHFAICNYLDDIEELGSTWLQGSIQSFSRARLNRYPQGSDMAPHIDHIKALFDGKDKGIPVLSVVGVFNRAEKGGEFLIKCPTMDEKEFLSESNTVVVFPSCFIYEHRVSTVEEGVRDSYVSWAY